MIILLLPYNLIIMFFVPGTSEVEVDVITDDPCLDGYKNFITEGKVSATYM